MEKKNMTKIWTVSSNRILIFSPKILNVARSHGDETKQLCRLHKMADMSCSSPYLDFASISLHESPNVTRWCVHDKNSLDKLNVPLMGYVSSDIIRLKIIASITSPLNRRNFATNSRKCNNIEDYLFFHVFPCANVRAFGNASGGGGEEGERSDNFEMTRFIY